MSEADHVFLRATARVETGRLTLATILKMRLDLGFFPALEDVDAGIVTHLAKQLGLMVPPPLRLEDSGKKTLYRYRAAVRAYLGVAPYPDAGEVLVTNTVLEAAETMSDPADLINRAIEALRGAMIDLPAFSTLDRLVNHLRGQVHERMYERVAARLSAETMAALDALLTVPPDSATTPFNRLKQTPGPARFETIALWTERLAWLTGLLDPDQLLEGISHTKLRQFAAEAAALEAGELLDMSQRGKRHTLLLSLIRQARTRCRDELIEMLIRRVRRTQAAAKKRLAALQDENRALEERLIALFGRVLATAKAEETDAAFGRHVRTLLTEQGGIDRLAEHCETVTAWHGNNDLPLLWPLHARTRSLLFRLVDLMDIRSATQDRSLLDALAMVAEHRHARRDDLPYDLNLGFASQRWHSFIVKGRSGSPTIDRRALEVCVFIHLADALQAWDVYVLGAEAFADYRDQLLPWPDCAPRLAAYCRLLAMPESVEAFVAQLKDELTQTAAEMDAGFPDNTELTLDADGTPHLKKQRAAREPDGLADFEREIRARMPERHLLDILKHTEHWSGYTRHFGPPSGSDPKLANAVRRYLFAVFGYGCNLGPLQTARHAPDIATAQALRRINAQHINADKLEAAMADVIGQYTASGCRAIGAMAGRRSPTARM